MRRPGSVRATDFTTFGPLFEHPWTGLCTTHHILHHIAPYCTTHKWHTTNGLRSVHPSLTRIWCHHMDKGVARHMCTCGQITPPVCAQMSYIYGAPQWDTCSRGGHVAVMHTFVHYSVHAWPKHPIWTTNGIPQMAYHKWSAVCAPIFDTYLVSPHGQGCGTSYVHMWSDYTTSVCTNVLYLRCPAVGHVLAWWSRCCNDHLCTSFGPLVSKTPYLDHKWHTTPKSALSMCIYLQCLRPYIQSAYI